MQPKVFISYSWTSFEYQQQILRWAEQLQESEVEVILDLWDLKPGDDVHVFMEQMVVDEKVTHVLVFCDARYAAKADMREGGVGTESQVISSQLYSRVKDSKFLPIVCEWEPDGSPCLPTFMKSRKWFDFSSPEAANQTWEELIRHIHGKPRYVKPPLGKKPAYLTDTDDAHSGPSRTKLDSLKRAIQNGGGSLIRCRQDFLDECFASADSLRIRKEPDRATLSDRIVSDFQKLRTVRNLLVDWVLAEAVEPPNDTFNQVVLNVLERLLHLKFRPDELKSWSSGWFEAHELLVYETFLYIVAALVRCDAYQLLGLVFRHHFLLPSSQWHKAKKFDRFTGFWAGLEQVTLTTPNGRGYLSVTGELVHRSADRVDLPFGEVVQAELLVLLMTFLRPEGHWYPHLLHYSSHANAFPLFVRAIRQSDYKKLALITGFTSGNDLRAAVTAGIERTGVDRWNNFRFAHGGFAGLMSLDQLDTLA